MADNGFSLSVRKTVRVFVTTFINGFLAAATGLEFFAKDGKLDTALLISTIFSALSTATYASINLYDYKKGQ